MSHAASWIACLPPCVFPHSRHKPLPSRPVAMSSIQRTQHRGTPTRRQKPVNSSRASNQNVPTRGPSGFLDGLKSIVAGPFSWFGGSGGGHGGDSDVENPTDVEATTGSKRRGGGGGGGGGRRSPAGSPPARKRAKRTTPPPGLQAQGGYLDPPPEVLRDSTILANGIGTGTHSMSNGIANGAPVENGIKVSPDLIWPLR